MLDKERGTIVNFTREERQQNMHALLSQIDAKTIDFNTLMFTMVDTVQSSFLNGLYMGKTPEEKEAAQKEIADLNDKLVAVLNQERKPLIVDVIVLSNLIMDSIMNAEMAKKRFEEAEEEVEETETEEIAE